MKRRHVNGLLILTAGNFIKNVLLERNKALVVCQNGCGSGAFLQQELITVRAVRFQVEPTDSQTVGGKRKRKRLQNGNCGGKMKEKPKGVVEPKDTIAIVELSNGEILDVKAYVLGTLLEVNTNLEEDPSLLLKDPLLDGYIGVIMPTGSFPPREALEGDDTR